MRNIYRWIALACILGFALPNSYAQKPNYQIKLKSGTINSEALMAPSEADHGYYELNRFKTNYYVMLQFNELPSNEEKEVLKQYGIELLDYIPNNAFIARVPVTFPMKKLSDMNVRAVVNIQPQHKYATAIVNANWPDHTLLGGDLLALSAEPYKGITKDELRAELGRNGFQVVDRPGYSYEVTVHVNVNDIERLATVGAVMFLAPSEAPPVLDGLRGRTLHRANTLSSSPGTGYDGTGVVIGIADDGGISHVDFKGRFTDFNSSAGGTHGDMVSGIACGAGNINPIYVGMATGSYLNMYSISGYPHVVNAISNYNNLGTVVTSTSYSQGCGGTYESTARNLDQDVNTQNVLLHVFSAGNSASSTCSGVYGSLVPPGGNRYGNITGGRKAAKNSIATANMEFDDDRTASSSRGPAEDGRLKPDISAMGTGQLTTAPDNGYQSGGGTSAACPGIAGVSAMLYQAYKDLNGGTEPMSSLIKGTLLNTADDLGRTNQDYDFGWGRVNARRAVEVLENNQVITSSISNGNVNTHTISVPSNVSELKVMVYWLDPEGSTTAAQALVNDLDLELTRSGTTWFPWILSTAANIDSIQRPAFRGRDRVNNMEQTTVANPASGNYTVRVRGFSVPQGPQTYHVIYSYIMNEIEVTYPTTNDPLPASTSEVIRWDAAGNAGTFTVEYSTNNGSSWTTISSSVGGAERFISWTTPNVSTGQGRIRVSRSGQSATSQQFDIIGTPGGLSISSAGTSTATFTWNSVSGATGYDVYAIGSQYMDIIGSSSGTSFTISGLSSNDENWYSVRAKNAGSGILGRRAVAIKYVHNPTSCSNCLSSISSYPYSESFETGIGAWCQEPADDIDWTRLSGSTGSSNTGPTAAADGSFYMYIEASSPNFPSKTASFASPCFDLNSAVTATATFQYHMWGAAMGTLILEASTDGGTAFTQVWSRTNDQGNAWNTATVNLDSYVGNDVILRFRGTTGSSFTSDMAIDDFELDATFGGGGGCTSTISSFPYTENFDAQTLCGNTLFACIANGTCNLSGGWENAGGDNIDWSVDNANTPSSNTGPASDHTSGSGNYLFTEASSCFNNTGYVLSPCFNFGGASSVELTFWYHMWGAAMGTLSVQASTDGGNTWSGNLWSRTGDQGNGWQQGVVNLSLYSSQSSVRLRFTGATGSSYTSDIAIDDVAIQTSGGGGCSTTLSQNFDSQTLCGNTLFACITDGTCGLSGGWTNAGGDDIDWSVDNLNSPSSNTGPSNDHTGSGNFVFTEASGCYSQTAYLESPCFNNNGYITPTLEFWYHMWGAAMGSLSVQVSTNGGSTWSGNVWSLSGDRGNSWQRATVNLSTYRGSNVKVRFTGVTGTAYTSDIALDDINLFDGAILAPGTSVAGNNADEADAAASAPLNGLSVQVYPIPANDNLKVLCEGFEPGVELMVTDLFGKSLMMVNTGSAGGEFMTELNVSTLPAGTYFLRAKDAGSQKVVRFSIQR